jgi:hypothetical protein
LLRIEEAQYSEEHILQLIKQTILGHFFNLSVYSTLKQQQRPKFYQIGLKFLAQLFNLVAKQDNQELKLRVLQESLKPDLLKILVKNCQTAKSILHQASNEVR